MDHMKMKWVLLEDEDDDGVQKHWKIVTDEAEPWFIAEVCRGLPGDDNGLLTAKAICDAHNATLV